MQDAIARYVSIPSTDAADIEADIEMDDGVPRLSVERTIVDLVDDLDRAEDLDAVIRTALRHRLTTVPRLRRRALTLGGQQGPHAAAVLDSLARLGAAPL